MGKISLAEITAQQAMLTEHFMQACRVPELDPISYYHKNLPLASYTMGLLQAIQQKQTEKATKLIRLPAFNKLPITTLSLCLNNLWPTNQFELLPVIYQMPSAKQVPFGTVFKSHLLREVLEATKLARLETIRARYLQLTNLSPELNRVNYQAVFSYLLSNALQQGNFSLFARLLYVLHVFSFEPAVIMQLKHKDLANVYTPRRNSFNHIKALARLKLLSTPPTDAQVQLLLQANWSMHEVMGILEHIQPYSAPDNPYEVLANIT